MRTIRDSVELDEIYIECPICDRSIPATSKTCQFCGTGLSMSGLDELEELALHVDDFYPESHVPAPEAPVEEPGQGKDLADVEGVSEPADDEDSGDQDDLQPAQPVEEKGEAYERPKTMAEAEQERKDLKKERKEEKVAVKAEKRKKRSLKKAEKRERRLGRKVAKGRADDGGAAEEHSH